MPSISDKLRQINEIKQGIKEAILAGGGTVGDDFSKYPEEVSKFSIDYKNPDFYDIRTQNGTNFDSLFRGYSGQDIDVSQWDTSKVTSAKYCFGECKNSIDISNWDLSSLKNAYYMFYYFTNNNKYIDLSSLDFSSVTNAQYMFQYSNTDYLDIRNINLTGTTSYNNLFSFCKGKEVNLSSWDISNITDLYDIFYFADFKKIDLTGWNTINVTNMNYVFYYCRELETLLIPDWDMTNATNTGSFISEVPKLKYIDLSRSNDLTIKKIASFLTTKKVTTYGKVVIPADTSQDAIDALIAKYWKPIGPKLDLTSIELVLELDEIKPGKTTKVWTGNSDPWYGDDRPETIEFISSDESIATINGREITSTGVEGTVDIICRRRSDGVVLGSSTLTVSEIDSNPNLIKFKTNGKEGTNNTILIVNGIYLKSGNLTKDPITGIYSYDPGKQITSIKMASTDTQSIGYINEIVKLNFSKINATSMECMFSCYQGEVVDLRDLNTSNIISAEVVFKSNPNLIEVIGELDFSNLERGLDSASYWTFYDCPKLETIYLKNIYKNSIMTNDKNWSITLTNTKIKDECLIYIINELPDLINDKGLTATNNIILRLPKTNTLTAEQVQVAKDKGWNVVNTTY